MNTGHDGSLSTGHANSCEDMLHRLETMVLMGMELPLTAIRGQIASGVDILVHVGRMRDGSRKLLNIMEVGAYTDGRIELSPLWEFQEKGEKRRKSYWGMEKQGEIKEYTKIRVGGYREILIAAGITALIARLFYQSVKALLLFFPVCYFYRRYSAKKERGEEKTPVIAGI